MLLQELAAQVGKQHGLEANWLNNGPASLAKDLLASKLYAFCDRDEQDLNDILGMKPAWTEIESLKVWLLNRDGSTLWPGRVESRLNLLKKRMGHE